MARPEVTGRRPDDADAFGIAEFCRRHRISIQLYYKLKSQNLTPDEFRLGSRVLISRESAERWRRQRERANATP